MPGWTTQFFVYEAAKRMLSSDPEKLSGAQLVLAGWVQQLVVLAIVLAGTIMAPLTRGIRLSAGQCLARLVGLSPTRRTSSRLRCKSQLAACLGASHNGIKPLLALPCAFDLQVQSLTSVGAATGRRTLPSSPCANFPPCSCASITTVAAIIV